MYKLTELIQIAAYCFFYYLIDPSVWLFSRVHRNKPNKKTVLLVRPDSIGDFILWLDSAKEYKCIYPDSKYRITLLTNQDWAELAQSYTYWDEIIVIDREKFLTDLIYRWQFLKKIYLSYYDITIHPIFSRIFWLGDSIVRISASPERIGWDLYKDLNSPFLFSIKKKTMRSWYTRLISLNREKLMELEKNAQFIRALGAQDFKSGIPKLIVHGVKYIPEDYFVIVPEAAWDGREWALKNFMEIAKKMQSLTGWKVIFLGTQKSLYSLVNKIDKNMDSINLIGKTKFIQYMNIVAQAKTVIANESSAIHIAAAANVPAFSVTGGGHWGRFIPYKCDIDDGRKPIPINELMDCYKCDWLCIFKREGPVKCIKDISVQKAWDIISSSPILKNFKKEGAHQ